MIAVFLVVLSTAAATPPPTKPEPKGVFVEAAIGHYFPISAEVETFPSFMLGLGGRPSQYFALLARGVIAPSSTQDMSFLLTTLVMARVYPAPWVFLDGGVGVEMGRTEERFMVFAAYGGAGVHLARLRHATVDLSIGLKSAWDEAGSDEHFGVFLGGSFR